MAKLELFLLGPPRLERDGVPLQFDTRKIMALVAYLAVSGLEGQGVHLSRDSLLVLLWPDLEPSRARAVLRRNLSLLRSALEGEWLVVDRQMISTDPQVSFRLDVEQFTHLVRAWETHGHPQEQVCPECLGSLAKAVDLYQGDFLEGFGLRDSVAFDDWQFFQAERLRQELASALERLVSGHSAHGNQDAALIYARQWLALDPFHEPAHRQLMQLYAQTGQRSAALRQYQECLRILGDELGVTPARQTTDLYEQIRTLSFVDPRPASTLDRSNGEDLPVRTGPFPHNLPAQTTPFVGREEELAEIGAQLQDPACRLLTLLGPGGIGKTRLALRLAEDLLEAEPTLFEHGAFFVPLAPLQSSEGVVPAVGEALNFTFHASDEGTTRATPHQQLLDFLGQKKLLLVMDNYEHLLVDGKVGDGERGSDGIGLVTDVLSTAPGVKILVTSRASLKVQGEHLYPLSGLRVPDAMLPVVAEDWQMLRGYSAVELFVQGGQRVRPDFELRSQDMPHVAHICRLVQGMPLGILLAAAWIEMLSPEEIATEIQHSLDFLETDLRDVPLRQRSLRAVFDHSWRLLSEREREIFQGLSVFHGGFTREAALDVAGASLRDLVTLINKSLVYLSSLRRYELHELLRQYGADQLDSAPDHGEAVRDRHCAHYTSALARWATELKGARQQEAVDEMDLEIENARAAWYWALEHGQVARLAQSVDGVSLYHAWRMRHEEGEAAYRAAARVLKTINSPDAQRLRAKCLVLWSRYQVELGKKQGTVEAAERGLALLQELERAGHDVRRERALAALHWARMLYYAEDPLEAEQRYAHSVALYEEIGDRWGLARALADLGWMAEHLGHYGEARELCERSLAIRRELGDERGMADAMLTLGIVSWVQGRLDEAHRLLRESLGIYRALDDWNRVAHTLKSLGEVLVRRGQFEDGLALMESSRDIYGDLGHRYGAQGLLPFLAESQVHMGLYQEARAGIQQETEILRQTKHLWTVAFSDFVNGLAVLAEGVCHEAVGLFQASATAFQELQHPENRAWVLGPLGLAAHGTGDAVLARRSVVEALEIGIDLGAFMPVMYGLPAAALLLADRGAIERAVEVYACASRYGFVANSRWFEDVVGHRTNEMAATLPAEAVASARMRGQAQAWDAMAAQCLTELKDN